MDASKGRKKPPMTSNDTQGTRTNQDSLLDTNMKLQWKLYILAGFLRAVSGKTDVDMADFHVKKKVTVKFFKVLRQDSCWFLVPDIGKIFTRNRY